MHPSLSPAPPHHHHPSHPNSPYEPAAADGGEAEEEEDESDTAGLLLNSTAFGTFDSPPTKRAPLPSPTLFSEEDRLLSSNFPHLSSSSSKKHHHGSGRPRSRSLQSRSRASLDRSQHDEDATTSATAGTASIEMPDLSSLPTSSSSRHPPYEQGVRGTHSHSRMERRHHGARRSFAREVRTLLRLRAATVASLREVLFDDDDDDGGGDGVLDGLQAGSAPRDGDGFGREEERIETPPATPLRIHQAGGGPAFNFTSSAASKQAEEEAEEGEELSRRRGRLVGERMKELGWRGAGLGNGKLL